MKQNNEMTTTEQFGTTKVRIVSKDGEPVFIGKDVCAALGVRNSRQALSKLDPDEKGVTNSDTLGGVQGLTFVTESGLYHLIFISRKPVAKAFRRWVTDEVLPALRNAGFYANPNAVMRVRDYMSLRQIEGSVHGFGQSCMAICRKLGVQPELHSGSGHTFPVHVLDSAAKDRVPGIKPLTERPSVLEFIFNQSKVEELRRKSDAAKTETEGESK